MRTVSLKKSLMNPTTISAYRARLNITTPLTADLATLRLLQERHMLAVPFENFDVYRGGVASLNVEELTQKIIYRQRGGYCFELNTLYGALLRALGFTVKPVLARVLLRSPAETPPRNHLTNLVDLDGSWYVTDVGFGGLGSRVPLPIASTKPAADSDGLLRVVPRPDAECLIERQTTEGWQPQYQFQTTAAVPSDVAMANFHTYRHPDSQFVKYRLIGLFTPTGRIGLFGNQFSERRGLEVVEKREVPDGAEWVDFVCARFGVAAEVVAGLGFGGET